MIPLAIRRGNVVTNIIRDVNECNGTKSIVTFFSIHADSLKTEFRHGSDTYLYFVTC